MNLSEEMKNAKRVDENGNEYKTIPEYKNFNKSNLQLTYNDWLYIKDHAKFWQSQPNFKRVINSKDLNLIKENFLDWTISFLKIKYPNLKVRELEYKKSIEIAADLGAKGKDVPRDIYLPKDTIAFKLRSNMPELYLLIQDLPLLMTERMYDAYDLGPFRKPNWDESH